MLHDLKSDFKRIEAIEDPRTRGLRFEEFLTRIFDNEDIDFKGRYRPRSEEVDGAIFLYGRTYLIEARWRKDPEPASAVYAFRGKIEGKIAGTLGVFWSINGYSDNCVPTVIAGKTLNVLLFDRTDLEAIIEGEISFKKLLEKKTIAAGTKGDIYLPWSTISKARILRKHTDDLSLFAIVEGYYAVTILTSLFNFIFDKTKYKPVIIPSEGKANVLTQAPIYATILFSNPNAYCLVVMDRDADSIEFVDRFQDKLKNATGPGKNRLHLAVPNPSIWTWLNLSLKLPNPKLQEILKDFDWSDAISKHSDLDSLVEFLKQIET